VLTNWTRGNTELEHRKPPVVVARKFVAVVVPHEDLNDLEFDGAPKPVVGGRPRNHLVERNRLTCMENDIIHIFFNFIVVSFNSHAPRQSNVDV